MIYFHDFELALKSEIGVGPDRKDKIDFAFLGVLEVKIENDEIDSIMGNWYDINNTVYHLARQMPNLKGIENLADAVEKGAVTFKGRLEFSRLRRPVGTEI